MISTTDEKVFQLAKTIVDQEDKKFTKNSHLFEEHILDSFGLIQLVGEIDSEFSININSEDLTIQNFSTIQNIAALVDRYLAKKIKC
jgi:D-alanine--poly(phosphoribitol) ligase subunit 2